MAKGAHKGSAFERKICKQLSLWMSRGTRGDLLWRTAGSGARATTARKKGQIIQGDGDIIAVDRSACWLTDSILLELKHYRDLQVLYSLFNDAFLDPLNTITPKLLRFWLDTVDKAREANKFPVMVYKENQRPTMILLYTHLYRELERGGGSFAGAPRAHFEHVSGTLMKLESFFTCVHMETMRQVLKPARTQSNMNATKRTIKRARLKKRRDTT